MYQNKFVASLKSEGKVLRERNGNIRLPFGSEYSLLLKNLESRNVVVSVNIDGEDVLDRNRLVIGPNAELELEGFMRGRTAKNKFKFIKRTQNIEDYRGIHIDDGLIRINFQFEKMKPIVQEITYANPYGNWWIYPNPYPYRLYNSWEYDPYTTYTISWTGSSDGGTASGEYSGNISMDMGEISCMNSSVSEDAVGMSASFNANAEEPGITTKGSQVSQSFSQCYTDTLEDQSHTIILKLVGYTKEGNTIKKPIFTREKIVCPICGGSNRSLNRFCYECGTSLQ